MTQYILEIPRQDPSLAWHTVKVFDTEEEAIAYSDKKLGTTRGYYCMLSYDGEYYIADTPNPNLNSTNNQHLAIEAFFHKEDCLYFIQANFNSDSEGNIYLISEM